MPVFNSSSTIHQAIQSVLSQDYENFELIISDNNSTDSTADICLYYVNLDPRVRYFRQKKFISAPENFDFVLKKSRGEFFVWAAGDDKKSRNFLRLNLNLLKKNPAAVASMSPIFFEKNEILSPVIDVGPFTEELTKRYIKFFRVAYRSHGIFYSLIRKSCLENCDFVKELFFGCDWAIILYLLKQGEILVANGGYTIFGTSGISNSPEVYKFHGVTGWKRAMPFLDFSLKVLNLSENLGMKHKFTVMLLLVRLNLVTGLNEFRITRYVSGIVRNIRLRFYR